MVGGTWVEWGGTAIFGWNDTWQTIDVILLNPENQNKKTMTKATIKSYRDGDSGELEDIGRFRLSNVHMPNKTDVGYNAAKRAIQKLVPEGSDVDVRVVGRDEYGRKIVEMRHRGKSINEAMSRRFPDHR